MASRFVIKSALIEAARRPLIGWAMVFGAVLLLHGTPVPFGDETLYLMLPAKQANPEFLLNDWSLSEPWLTHQVFVTTVSPLFHLFSMEVAGWLGRLLFWSINAFLLVRLGGYFRIPPALTAMGVVLWLALDQTTVPGSDWLFHGFLAKEISYMFVLLAVHLFLARRFRMGGLCLGLGFSFHPLVGCWVGLAIGCGLLAQRVSWKELLNVAVMGLLGSIPGLMVFGSAAGGSELSIEGLQFVASFQQPWKLNPMALPKRDVLTTFLLLIFNVWVFRRARQMPQMWFFFGFQMGLTALFFSSFLLRMSGDLRLARFYPHLYLPTFVLLLFFLHLALAYRQRWLTPGLATLALFALLGLGNPVAGMVDLLGRNMAAWSARDDLGQALEWVGENTPNGSICIAPPWRGDAWSLSRRAQIALWAHPVTMRLEEWRERIVAMVGEDLHKAHDQSWAEVMGPHFDGLTEDQIAGIRRRFGGDYLVTRSSYTFEVLFDTGTYRVYSLAVR